MKLILAHLVLWALAAGFVLLAGAQNDPHPLMVDAAAPTTAVYDAGMPPPEYRHGGAALVIFTDRDGVEANCGKAEPGHTIIACSGEKNGVPVIVMPNPCPLAEHEFYALIACHELSHVNGWPGNHPRKAT